MRLPVAIVPGVYLVVLAGLPLLAMGCGGRQVSDEMPPRGGFLAGHWSRPLSPQGDPPDHFTSAEASLDPSVCGACHVSQFQDWSGSEHSRAMSPGLLGQLVEMDSQDRSEHAACLSCHAPLREQAESLV